VFLPVVGLVDPKKLTPGDLVGVNKDSYLILDFLPAEYDSRVKAMEVDERPTEEFNSDVGGLDKQIQELLEVSFFPCLSFPPVLTVSYMSGRLGCCQTHDAHTPLQENQHQAAKRCSVVRPSWYRQNLVGSCVRCCQQSLFLENRCSFSRAGSSLFSFCFSSVFVFDVRLYSDVYW
jgi:hypothetical protein